jgi:cytochrome c-type biogenesis protein
MAALIGDVASGLAAWWAPALAFAAGVLSFASPCVLPLVPGYLSFVTGATGTPGAQAPGGGRRLAPILLFIAGFTIVFTTIGVFGAALIPTLRGSVGRWVTGGFVVLIGLAMVAYAFAWGRPGWYAERRPFLERMRPGAAGSLPLGMAFAAGWTPCIGPVLAGIFAISSQQSAARGGLLFAVYSLGLGVPFLLLGLGVQRLMRGLGWLRRHYRAISAVSGALLVVVGVLLGTGRLTLLFARLARFEPPL